MLRTMLKSKIHRATVTQADLHYVGSVTIDEDLMDAADLLPGRAGRIVDIDNGARLETYVIPGQRGSGIIGINGAAARLVHPGDLVIIISYGQCDAEARSSKPQVVHVDAATASCHRRRPGRARAGRRDRCAATCRAVVYDRPADSRHGRGRDPRCSLRASRRPTRAGRPRRPSSSSGRASPG